MLDHAAARAELGLPELLLDGSELIGNDRRDARRRGQDVEQVGDLGHHVLVLTDDLVLLEPGEALQAHLQDLAGLCIGQAIQAFGLQAVVARQALGAVGVAAPGGIALGAREHVAHQR